MVRLFLLRVLESYFRHRWLYLLPIVLMLIASGFAIYTEAPKYNASGTLYVQGESLVASLNNIPREPGTFGWQTPSQVTVAQINELLQTEAFVRSITKDTSFEPQAGTSSKQIQEMITKVNKTVTVSSAGDNLIQFGATYKDPQVAHQLATKLMEGYVLWKLNADRQDSITAQSFFKDLMQPYQDELNLARQNLDTYVKDHPTPQRGSRPDTEQIEVDRLQEAVKQSELRVQGAREKEESARLAQVQAERGVRQTYLMIDSPKMPTDPTNGLRTTLLYNSIYLIIGIILSVVGVLGSAVLDSSMRFPLDIRSRLHLPVLAITPSDNTATLAASHQSQQLNAAPQDREPTLDSVGGPLMTDRA